MMENACIPMVSPARLSETVMGIEFQLVEDEGAFATWIAEGSNGIDSYEMRVGQEDALAGNLLIADLDVSRFCAALSARLGHFPFEGDGAFPA